MVKDKAEFIRSWFMKGDEDLYAAQKLYQSEDYVPVSVICFHCQQAAEKYLKGLLLFYDIEFRKTHDLLYLLSLLEDQELREILFAKADFLNDFAVEPRYPGEWEELPLAEAEEALVDAFAVRSIVLERAQEIGYVTPIALNIDMVEALAQEQRERPQGF